MNEPDAEHMDSRMQAAVDALRDLICQKYPGTTFQVMRDWDEPENVNLIATVDVDDPDEVLDLVDERLEQFQVEERIPVHVIPIRTPERVLAEMEARRDQPSWPVRRILSRRAG